MVETAGKSLLARTAVSMQSGGLREDHHLIPEQLSREICVAAEWD